MGGSGSKKYVVRKLSEAELAAKAKAEKKAKGGGAASLFKGWPGLVMAFAGLVIGASLLPVSTRLALGTAGFMFVVGLAWFAMGENPMAD